MSYDRDRYSNVAIALHWTSAALILALFILGWRMVALPLSPSKFELYALHKSLGVLVLALTIFRIAWRLVVSPPRPVHGPSWQRYAASTVHAVLYALLFALPLSGWIFNSVVGFPLSIFGLFELPPLITPQPSLKEFSRVAHVLLGWVLLALLLLHVAAALYHQCVLGDRILIRMLPSLPQPARGKA